MRRLGYRADRPDPRDHALGALLGAPSSLPRSVSLRAHVPEVYDQASTNSCVAQSIVLAMRTEQARRGRAAPALSRLYLYHAARALTGDQLSDGGTYLRSGVRALQRLGVPTEDAWPFDTRVVNQEPSWAAHRAAHDRFGMRGYYRCLDLDDVRRALAAGLPVAAGWQVPREFLDERGPSRVSTLDGPIAGGHAMAIVGYDDDDQSVELANSWGEGWRDGGFVRLAYAAAEGFGDAWAIDCS